MTKDEALRTALEVLERVNVVDDDCDIFAPSLANAVVDAITAIKAALEAKGEPVAHSVVAGALFDFMGWLTSRDKRLILSNVDEASPAVEAITEFAKKRNLSLKYAEVGYWMEFLSTPPQQEAKDEPVAWMRTSGTGSPVVTEALLAEMPEMRWNFQQPLYTTPQQRKQLTDEEIDAIEFKALGSGPLASFRDYARRIEAAHGIKG